MRAQALVCGSTALTDRMKSTGKPFARSYSLNASNGLLRMTPPKSQNTALMSLIRPHRTVHLVPGPR